MANTNENEMRLEAKLRRKAFWKWVYRLRSVILAIHVALATVVIAIHNQAVLPSAVGFYMLTSGEYSFEVTKIVAVLGPVAVTAVCLLMTFCSRKVLYPWLISVFSLVLPLFIYFMSVFPG